jgi:hypothetical protein
LCYFVNFPPIKASDGAAANRGRREVGRIAHRAIRMGGDAKLTK